MEPEVFAPEGAFSSSCVRYVSALDRSPDWMAEISPERAFCPLLEPEVPGSEVLFSKEASAEDNPEICMVVLTFVGFEDAPPAARA